ncbi:MAG: hypothetical protein LBI18_05635, partial [Planctomycetaceae bacterium]|nr:hypothetical protein [Planctomycetaceae bacterium]
NYCSRLRCKIFGIDEKFDIFGGLVKTLKHCQPAMRRRNTNRNSSTHLSVSIPLALDQSNNFIPKLA